MCIEGEVHLFNDDIHEVIYAGETILVPAILPEINLVPNGKSKVLGDQLWFQFRRSR